MNNKKTWMNVLPMHHWTSLYNIEGAVDLRFMLDHYEIVQGVPKLTFRLRDNTLIETGVAEVALSANLIVRLYVPIELHRVPAIGFSPKLVYTFPKGYKIEEYSADAPPDVTPEETMYHAARVHTITSRG